MKSIKPSKKTLILPPQASTSNLPKQYIAHLNANITNVQQSVHLFNEAEERSMKWKKELNLKGMTCPLKTLTQPKYQNLLLEGKWNDKESFLFRDKFKGKQGKGAAGMRKSIVRRNTMYSGVSSVHAMRKTFSIGNETVRKTQQTTLKQSHAVQNPQTTLTITQPPPQKFNSFHQQIPLYNKPALLSRYQNYSQAQKSPNPTSTTHPNQTFANPTAQFSYHHALNNESGVSVIGEESKSVLMKSSLGFNNNENGWFDDSKQLELMPISQEKAIAVFNHHKNSMKIRNKITEKTLQLQKQWLKTQSYRERFNIISCQLTPSKDRKRSKTRVSISKLAHIIQKVSDRRPMTSQQKSRSVRTANQAITRNSNGQNDVSSHKASRINSSPNEELHKNLFQFVNFPNN